MYKIRIDPTYVHVHPMNRYGVGVYHREVVALLSDIADAGQKWSSALSMLQIVDFRSFLRKLNAVMGILDFCALPSVRFSGYRSAT